MSVGPCLCGDPYCPSCGDPALADFEEFMDALTDELGKLDRAECLVFVEGGRKAVALANLYLKEIDALRKEGAA